MTWQMSMVLHAEKFRHQPSVLHLSSPKSLSSVLPHSLTGQDVETLQMNISFYFNLWGHFIHGHPRTLEHIETKVLFNVAAVVVLFTIIPLLLPNAPSTQLLTTSLHDIFTCKDFWLQIAWIRGCSTLIPHAMTNTVNGWVQVQITQYPLSQNPTAIPFHLFYLFIPLQLLS